MGLPGLRFQFGDHGHDRQGGADLQDRLAVGLGDMAQKTRRMSSIGVSQIAGSEGASVPLMATTSKAGRFHVGLTFLVDLGIEGRDHRHLGRAEGRRRGVVGLGGIADGNAHSCVRSVLAQRAASLATPPGPASVVRPMARAAGLQSISFSASSTTGRRRPCRRPGGSAAFGW